MIEIAKLTSHTEDIGLFGKRIEERKTAIMTAYFNKWDGNFLGGIIDFLIVAIVVFIVMKKFLGFMQNMRKKEEAPAAPPAPPEPSAEEKLLTEIRDLLKK